MIDVDATLRNTRHTAEYIGQIKDPEAMALIAALTECVQDMQDRLKKLEQHV